MDDFPLIIPEVDLADYVRAVGEVEEQQNDIRFRATLLDQAQSQLGILEQQQGALLDKVAPQLMEVFKQGIERRWKEGELFRVLTLGLCSDGDARRAAEGGAADVRQFLSTVNAAHQEQMEAALERRILLVEMLNATHDEPIRRRRPADDILRALGGSRSERETILEADWVERHRQ